jgi:hypothetical protein
MILSRRNQLSQSLENFPPPPQEFPNYFAIKLGCTNINYRHSREGGNPAFFVQCLFSSGTPAFAGVTEFCVE